ncbi:uncharacterized protein LOC132734358 [Ruditapes philippinarum]|uniref:uncharacterized protein LOC132734358 n=1 Tax=Ruditapes philippinarum TaxID=129788 RepID=UPI00295B2C41|nr:uncharacterized protein LOC132734358 [Ruditapes philippinarum]
MGGINSCVSEKTSKKQDIEEVLKWFQHLDQHSDGDEIVIPRETFNKLFERLKEMANKDEHKTDQYVSAPRVQILDTRSTSAVTMFIKQLQYEIMHRNRIDTAVIGTVAEALQKTVLILVCNKGQGGSTKALVEKCLKDVEHCHYNRIILVIVHVMREQKLPKLPSSGEVKSEESFMNIGKMVDMGFYDDTIYQCDMNIKAIEEIVQFCREFRYPAKDESQAQHTILSVSNQPKDSSDQETNQPQFNYRKTDVIAFDGRRYPRKAVYLMTPSKTNAMSAFTKLFQARMRGFGIEIEEKEPSDAKNLDPSLLLMIVCNVTTRIESDIKRCYDDNLQAAQNRTILIALHVTTKGKEPKLLTEQKLAADSLFPDSSLIKIIDIAFNTEHGIYECAMNCTAEDYFRNLEANLTPIDNVI